MAAVMAANSVPLACQLVGDTVCCKGDRVTIKSPLHRVGLMSQCADDSINHPIDFRKVHHISTSG